MNKRKLHSYESDDIKVTYDLKRCIHAGECTRGLRDVFDINKKPWIQPGNAPADEIAEVIRRCPTGALQYERRDGAPDEVPSVENTVEIRPDGPLYLRGNIIIRDADGNELLRDTRAALCRCGLSADKPFCDNSHKNGFIADRSFDAARFEGAPVTSEIDALDITLRPNGSMLLRGTYTLKGETEVSSGKPVSLCRCGHSASKPFCDGAHKSSGFTA